MGLRRNCTFYRLKTLSVTCTNVQRETSDFTSKGNVVPALN